MSESSLYLLAELTGKALSETNHILATAESCTGGGIMQAMTEVPGSSGWCEGGFITYSNAAKKQLLAVPETTLQQYGAVSEQTVLAMAEGVLSSCGATVSVAVSGIAGPDGGTDDKPVGTVWVAWAGAGSPARAEKFLFEGDRSSVRRQTVFAALHGIIALCQQ
ncbi:CinA family protein [Sansalvadorimonas sp. 2012CJ34-2]|uniref:CinA family protein n=1 Tax=Parendozoicomonas callyspongiae TaxID=2942213 RepID=A0ABT0PI95_9GAMM|nr:CinA family protein [Sansalvadorimonas sp. 2012CJ34-2]MCL6271058.1 CinA family protein [Sansalvadorimonas sp. 2012CJ34-2]